VVTRPLASPIDALVDLDLIAAADLRCSAARTSSIDIGCHSPGPTRPIDPRRLEQRPAVASRTTRWSHARGRDTPSAACVRPGSREHVGLPAAGCICTSSSADARRSRREKADRPVRRGRELLRQSGDGERVAIPVRMRSMNEFAATNVCRDTTFSRDAETACDRTGSLTTGIMTAWQLCVFL